MGLFDKFKTNEIRNENDYGLPPVSEKDMARITKLLEDIYKVKDYSFYEKMKTMSIYIFPLESNTKLLSVGNIANEMVTELHYCIEAKIRLNLISEDFLSSDIYKKFMFSFTDGFIFDDLEEFSKYSDKKLEYHSKDNYLAYFCAYVLGLIDKLPSTPDDCDEKKLCSIITNFNSYSEMLNNCKLLSKERILYLSDYLSLESAYFVYKQTMNLNYSEELRWYKRSLMTCSYYVLSFDFESVMNKLQNTNDNGIDYIFEIKEIVNNEKFKEIASNLNANKLDIKKYTWDEVNGIVDEGTLCTYMSLINYSDEYSFKEICSLLLMDYSKEFAFSNLKIEYIEPKKIIEKLYESCSSLIGKQSKSDQPALASFDWSYLNEFVDEKFKRNEVYAINKEEFYHILEYVSNATNVFMCEDSFGSFYLSIKQASILIIHIQIYD